MYDAIGGEVPYSLEEQEQLSDSQKLLRQLHALNLLRQTGSGPTLSCWQVWVLVWLSSNFKALGGLTLLSLSRFATEGVFQVEAR